MNDPTNKCCEACESKAEVDSGATEAMAYEGVKRLKRIVRFIGLAILVDIIINVIVCGAVGYGVMGVDCCPLVALESFRIVLFAVLLWGIAKRADWARCYYFYALISWTLYGLLPVVSHGLSDRAMVIYFSLTSALCWILYLIPAVPLFMKRKTFPKPCEWWVEFVGAIWFLASLVFIWFYFSTGDFARTFILAKSGSVTAQYELGRLYMEGRSGVEQSHVAAVKWLRRAAGNKNAVAAGAAWSTLLWGYGFTERYAGEFKDDVAEAVKQCQDLAEEGDAAAQWELGSYYASKYFASEGHEAKHGEEAVKWLRKAAEQGECIAQFSLGWWYLNGICVEKSYDEGMKWIRKARETDAGVAYVMWSLLIYDDLRVALVRLEENAKKGAEKESKPGASEKDEGEKN